MQIIPLGNGYYATVDDIDYPIAMKSSWNYNKYNRCAFRLDGHVFVYLHREITNTVGSKDQHVRWRNNNPLDCRRENMYLVSAHETDEERKVRHADAVRRGIESKFKWMTDQAAIAVDTALSDHGRCAAADLMDVLGIARTTAIKYMTTLATENPGKYTLSRDDTEGRRLRGGRPFYLIASPKGAAKSTTPSDEDSDFDDDGKLF